MAFKGLVEYLIMKAVVYKQYGPPHVLILMDIEKPTVKKNEILVKIYSTTVTSGDTRLRASNFPPIAWLFVRLIYGLFKPKKEILGHEFSGVVEAVGKDVTLYKIGDEVLGTPTTLSTGSYTEYISVPVVRKKGVLGKKPKNLDFNEAAALPVGGMTALFLLDKAGLSKGQNVLVYGASGSVGSFAVQIAESQGAKVVAVCSGSNFEMVQSLGADSAIDYHQNDFTLINERFDIVFDAVGKITKSQAKKVLKLNGSFVSINAITNPKQEHLNRLLELTKEEKIKPYIDRCFSISEIVAAHEYVDQGRKKGNVVVEVAH